PSTPHSTAPQPLAAIPRPSQQTPRAITPASDLPNIARSTSAAPRRSPPSRPPSSVSVAASADDFPYKSRFRWYPERAICKALSLIRSRSRPARLSLRPDIALPFRRTSPNPASPSRPQRHLFPQSHRLSGGAPSTFQSHHHTRLPVRRSQQSSATQTSSPPPPCRPL